MLRRLLLAETGHSPAKLLLLTHSRRSKESSMKIIDAKYIASRRTGTKQCNWVTEIGRLPFDKASLFERLDRLLGRRN